MADPVVTLTTDFGERSPYVAVLKGVVLSITPAARILDLSHRVPPQDVGHAAYYLGTCVPFFPPGTIHVAVVDPGVGTERAALCVRVGAQWLVGPDNGIFTRVIERLGQADVWRLTESRYWRPVVSATFHGRDVFAPVAAHLASGVAPDLLGTRTNDRVHLPGTPAVPTPNGYRGAVQFIDDFGNVITNVPAGSLSKSFGSIRLAGRPIGSWQRVETYGDAPPGTLVVLASSDGFVELARVGGDGAASLRAAVGDPVEILFQSDHRSAPTPPTG